MSELIYLIQEQEQLVSLTEQRYDSEDLLQRLLAQYPGLLTGAHDTSSVSRQLLLVAREVGVPEEEGGSVRWSVDHLFIDEDAVPVIVEVKRSTDSRIRREVVGQMLDYAANAVVDWPVDGIRAQFEANCQRSDVDPEQAFAGTFGPELDYDLFWTNVNTNLKAGRVRLVFVADSIPIELKRIIEFLNEQMNPTNVIGIELKQYVGQGLQALVPRVIGSAKGSSDEPARTSGTWTDVTFDHALERGRGSEAVTIARHIRRWAESRSMRLWWGKGRHDGSCYLMVDHHGMKHWTIALWTSGIVQVQLGSMATRPPFEDEALRHEFIERLNRIPGVSITPDRVDKYPSFQIALLGQDGALPLMIEALEWAVKQIRAV